MALSQGPKSGFRGRNAIGVLAASATLAACVVTPAQALTFNFTFPNGTDQAAIDGFTAAGQLWSNVITDNIQVNIAAAYQSLGPGILAQASSTQATYAYSGVRSALLSDVASVDDLSTTALLPTTSVAMLLNRTGNNPNGSGSATVYVDNDGDANNTTIRMTNANAKALGLVAANQAGQDASITFSNNFAFDFDRSNGVSGSAYDFVSIAAHEIGHALGFISGVDILDINSPPVNGPFNDNQFTFVNTLDLFRFSSSSVSQGIGVIDWTADARAKYFSVNGGVTALGNYALGLNFGDGRQASHWKDNLGLGIMDPTLAMGELSNITGLDLRAFDVIGYNLAAVPEPASLGLLGLGAVAILRRRRVAC